MLYAALICSDETCASETEAWTELDELEHLACDSCGALLQPLALDEAPSGAAVVPLNPRTATPPLRRAA